MEYRVLLTVVMPIDVKGDSPEGAALNAIINCHYPIVDLPKVYNKKTGEKYDFVESKLVKREEEEE